MASASRDIRLVLNRVQPGESHRFDAFPSRSIMARPRPWRICPGKPASRNC